MAGLLQALKAFAAPSSKEVPANDAWIESLQLPMAVVHASGRVVQTNAAWRALGGLKQVPEVDLNGMHDLQTASKQWVRLSAQDCPNGMAEHKLYLATDISDLKNDYYRQLLDSFQDCVKVLDVRGRLVFLNAAGRTVLGVKPDQNLGMMWTDLLPLGVHHKVNQILEQVLSGEPAQFSNHSQFPGCEAETWHHKLTPYHDHEGRVIAALCVSRNITQDYDSQQATRQNEERLALAAKVGGLGTWDIDLSTDRIHCNDVWYKVMGIHATTAIGTMAQFLHYVHPEDVERVRSDWNARATIVLTQGDYKTSFRVIGDDGQTRNIRVAAAVMRDIADQPVRAIGFVSEITPE